MLALQWENPCTMGNPRAAEPCMLNLCSVCTAHVHMKNTCAQNRRAHNLGAELYKTCWCQYMSHWHHEGFCFFCMFLLVDAMGFQLQSACFCAGQIRHDVCLPLIPTVACLKAAENPSGQPGNGKRNKRKHLCPDNALLVCMAM